MPILNGTNWTIQDFLLNRYIANWEDFWTDFEAHLSLFYSATSTTSLTIGTGSKALTIQAGRAFAVGQYVRIAETAAPNTNYMAGSVTAHDATTGALTVLVDATAGSGTIAAWTISISGTGPTITKFPEGSIISNTTTLTTLATKTIPGGTLGTSGHVRFRFHIEVRNNTGSNVVFATYIKLGGTTLWASAVSVVPNAYYGGFYLDGVLAGNGSTAAQLLWGFGNLTRPNIATTGKSGWAGTNGASVVFSGTGTKDSTADQDLTLHMDMGTADTNAHFKFNGGYVEY